MSEYIFTDALGLNMTELAALDVETFQEFFFPVETTATEMARYCQNSNIDLGNTVVMYDGERRIGMSAFATRGRRGYIAGFGIIPEYRGRGVGKLLLAHQLEVARSYGLRSMQLEVLAQNTLAQRLYEGGGFKIKRGLANLKIAAEALPQHVTNAPVRVTEPELIMDWLMQGQQPAWDRERASLLVMKSEALVVNRPGGATAVMLYRRSGEGDKDVQLSAVALIDRTSTNDFLAMLRYAAEGAEKISVHDEPEGTMLNLICRDMGFEEEYQLHEMVVEL